ncbi:hypothetical protein LTS08_000718 [Lithohypha guttulata]|uniref:Cardiolipin synthase N-terminal domain-containing protein n=1 Tax=Lithohypha guttulata TaxID=1690604 RepID=A0AAN7T568_9EURO|nr:hypothetical protein LTR51_006670 [Lithohypha guttulata]KAK5088883.1 hypothetical protein LTR05_003105 [Lithohypha guttulata]KAK5106597.1 hypothetical protein LTS08_000718 [Lithohypha guttulata]
MLLQLALASMALAAPTMHVEKANAWQYGTGGGIVGFVVLILDLIVIIEVLQSTRPVSHKVGWSLLIFLFPIIGIILYWLFSNREQHKAAGGYEAIP